MQKIKETFTKKVAYCKAKRRLQRIKNRRIGSYCVTDGITTSTMWIYSDPKDKDGVVFRRTKRPFREGDVTKVTFFNNEVKGEFDQEAMIDLPMDLFPAIVVKR